MDWDEGRLWLVMGKFSGPFLEWFLLSPIMSKGDVYRPKGEFEGLMGNGLRTGRWPR